MDNQTLDEIGIPGEMMMTIGGPYLFPPRSAEQITFPHQAQHSLMVHCPSFVLKLMSNPAIAIAGKLKADSFNTIHEISLPFLLLRALGFVLVVEGAMSNIHKLAPPSDTADEVPAPGDDLPFLGEWLRLLCNPLFRNSFSSVSLPTSRSSFSTLSLRAASSVGSLLNLPWLYCFFQ